MKTIIFLAFMLVAATGIAQTVLAEPVPVVTGFSLAAAPAPPANKRKDVVLNSSRWKITENHLWTGGMVLVAGAAKGFNETLQFHWKEFKRQFPKANPQWFNPAISYKNKYKNHNSQEGPKFFLSTTALVMFTDQYHLNNFINKLAWGSALVIKIGEGKKPLKQYLLDLLYYTACHQAGFAATYYPFSKYRKK